MAKPLNIGMIGYGFMGKAHSNAFTQAIHFFDLPYKPVLKAVCARSADKVKPFADNWGYEAIETDCRKGAPPCGASTWPPPAAASPAICSRTASTPPCG